MGVQIDAATEMIMDVLGEHEAEPLRPLDVISTVREREPQFRSNDVPVRLALWRLLDDRRVRFTDSHRVIATPVAGHIAATPGH